MIEELGSGRKWITGDLQQPFGRAVSFQIPVSDARKLHDSLQKAGYSFFLPLEEKWYRTNEGLVGHRQFIIQDPDGFFFASPRISALSPLPWRSIGMIAFIVIFLSYLLGSIPFGYVLTRLAGMGDIRNIGSGNIGATNVLRTGNKKTRGADFVFDGIKGAVAVSIALRHSSRPCARLPGLRRAFVTSFRYGRNSRAGTGSSQPSVS